MEEIKNANNIIEGFWKLFQNSRQKENSNY